MPFDAESSGKYRPLNSDDTHHNVKDATLAPNTSFIIIPINILNVQNISPIRKMRIRNTGLFIPRSSIFRVRLQTPTIPVITRDIMSAATNFDVKYINEFTFVRLILVNTPFFCS